MAINRTAQHRESNELIDILAGRFAPQIRRSIKKAVYGAAEEFRIKGVYSDDIFLKHSEEMEYYLNRLITRSIIVSAKRQQRILKDLAKSKTKAEEIDLPEDELSAVQKFFSLSFLKKNIAEIVSTTKKKIANFIDRKQQNEELSRDDIADELKKEIGDNQSVERAALITVFVAHTAINWSSLNESKIFNQEVREELKKEWISMRDDKVRDDHAEADGQTVGLDDFFLVGGEQLEYPGDPNGSIENIINCRCIVGYI